MMTKFLVCLSDCGYGDGVFHVNDIKYIYPRPFIDFLFLKNFPFCEPNLVELLLDAMKNHDVVLFPFHSSAFIQFLTFIGEKKKDLFLSLTIKKILWTLDNHLFFKEDLVAQRICDFVYASHPNYFSHFYLNLGNVRYLPSAYYLTDIDRYMELLQISVEPYIDILCNFRYFKHHSGHVNGRVEVAFNILRLLENRAKSLKIVFADVPSGENYINAIRSSRIVLNISMLDDFNIRNFEVIAFDRVLLASQTSAHQTTQEIFNLNFSNTILFKRDCSDFICKVAEAENCVPRETYLSILNNNMLVHRYVSIMNDFSDVKYYVRQFDKIKKSGESNKLDFKINKLYTPSDVCLMRLRDILSLDLIDKK